MDNQTAFDKVWQHFVTEGNPPGMMSSGYCRYRAEGRCCAIGVLIPDDQYTEELERWSLSEVLEQVPALYGWGGELPFLLRRVHDSAAGRSKEAGNSFQEAVREGLLKVAEEHKLTVPGEA